MPKMDRARGGYLLAALSAIAATCAYLLIYERMVLDIRIPFYVWGAMFSAPLILATVPMWPERVWRGRFAPLASGLSVCAFLLPVYLAYFLMVAMLLRGVCILTTPPFLRPPHDISAATLIALFVTIYGTFEASKLRVTKLHLSSPLVKNPVCVTLIADLHIGMIHDDRFVARLARIIKDIKPDILISAGDLIDGDSADHRRACELLRLACPPIAFAVTGNHEHYAGISGAAHMTRKCGFKLLRNETAHACGITFVGMDDSGRYTPLHSRELKRREYEILSSIPDDRYVVLIKHRPKVHTDSIGRFNLQLSGHVHGGQLMPWGLPAQTAYRYSRGLYRLGIDSFIYVSRGTGTWGPPARIGASPEVTCIYITPAGHI